MDSEILFSTRFSMFVFYLHLEILQSAFLSVIGKNGSKLKVTLCVLAFLQIEGGNTGKEILFSNRFLMFVCIYFWKI
jgi:hypothetical protein